MNARKSLSSIGLCALLAAAGAVQATPLSDLLNGGSITVGDKRFDQWTLIQNGPDPVGIPADLTKLDVTGITIGDLGLKFVFDPGHSVTGDGLYAFSDLTFGFRVSVTDPGWVITDNTLALTGSSLVYTADGDNDLGVFIDEKVGTAAGLNDLARKTVTNSVLDDIPDQELTDAGTFAGQSQVFVTKNILVWARDLQDSATLFSFEQRFSQSPSQQPQAPEPASLLLVGMALAGLGFARARKA